MAFTLVAAGVGNTVEPVSNPYGISVAAVNDGAGGTITITQATAADGAPPTAVDLKTFFGTAFKSFLFLAFFNRVWPQTSAGTTAATREFFRLYQTVLTMALGSDPEVLPFFTAPALYGGKFSIDLNSPAIAGQQFVRIDMYLRHSIVR